MNLEQKYITSLEVAEMVEKPHNDLLKDVRRYIANMNEGNISHVDFFTEGTYKDAKGETRPCFNITKKGCEFIANKLTGVKGTSFTARYINRFHEMQDELNLPTTYKEALQHLLIEVEKNEKLAIENKEMKPKAEFFDAVADSKDAIPMGDVAKVLNVKGVGRNKLFEILREKKVLMNNNIPYQKYIDSDWFRTIEQKFSKNGEVCISIKTLVYQKGVNGIRKILEGEV